MANNRLYLRCNACGKKLFLGKSFLMGYYWENYAKDGKHLEDKLNEFYDEHTYCEGGYDDGDFSLEYESPIYDGGYIRREDALSYPFANGQYDKEHASKDFVAGCESYKEWLADLPIILNEVTE